MINREIKQRQMGTWAFEKDKVKDCEKALDALGNIGDLTGLKTAVEKFQKEWWNIIGDDIFYDALDAVKSSHELDDARAHVSDAAGRLHKIDGHVELKRQTDALVLKKQRKNESRILSFKDFMKD